MACRIAVLPGLFWVSAILAVAPLISGCVGMAIGAAATGGVATSQERGFHQAVEDNRIEIELKAKLLDESLHTFRSVNITIHEGRVLATGSVARPEQRIEALKRMWQVNGVREVINEITVGDSPRTGRSIRDAMITTELRSAITLDPQILSVNYTLETEDGTIYLMGIAQNAAELERVIAYARNLRYVSQVVSFVRLKSENLPNAVPDTGAPAASPAPPPAPPPAASQGGRT